MKRFLFTAFAAAALAGGTLLMNTSAQTSTKPAAAAPYRHIVCFKFKDTAKPEEVDAVVKAFAALKGKIPSVQGFEWGKECSPEGHSQGLTHIFTLTFAGKDAIAGEGYLTHPEHLKIVELLKPILDKALVVDYTAQ